MEARTYECQYCRKEYVPKRRGVQKFYSKPCNSRYWNLNQNTQLKIKLLFNQEKLKEHFQKTKNERTNFQSVINLVAGTVLITLDKNVLVIDSH